MNTITVATVDSSVESSVESSKGAMTSVKDVINNVVDMIATDTPFTDTRQSKTPPQKSSNVLPMLPDVQTALRLWPNGLNDAAIKNPMAYISAMHHQWSEASREYFFAETTKNRVKPYRESVIAAYNLNENCSDESIEHLVKVIEQLELCNDCDGENCRQKRHEFHPETYKIVDGRPLFTSPFTVCAKRRNFLARRKTQQQLKAARIPSIYHNLTLDAYRVDPNNFDAVELVTTRLVAGFPDGRGIYFSGKCGAGKTMLMSIIANELIKRGRSVIFVTVPQLIQSLKEAIDDPKRSPQSLLDALCEVEVLFLDDFLANRTTSYVSEQLGILFNARYEHARLTFVTSNYAPHQLESRLRAGSASDEDAEYMEMNMRRLVSRIRVMMDFAELGGGDRRVLAGKPTKEVR